VIFASDAPGAAAEMARVATPHLRQLAIETRAPSGRGKWVTTTATVTKLRRLCVSFVSRARSAPNAV
jgi:hypothetical protein